MAHAHTPHEADCNSLARRYSGALLLLAIASLLVACGGAGGGGGGGGGGVCAVTGAAPAVLTWNAVTAPTPAAGYRIYYGTAPGTYLQASGQGVNVGSGTTTQVMALSGGTTYYFAVTAYDSSNPPNESAFSNEVCKTIS